MAGVSGSAVKYALARVSVVKRGHFVARIPGRDDDGGRSPEYEAFMEQLRACGRISVGCTSGWTGWRSLRLRMLAKSLDQLNRSMLKVAKFIDQQTALRGG
jgi:hypothetical protein